MTMRMSMRMRMRVRLRIRNIFTVHTAIEEKYEYDIKTIRKLLNVVKDHIRDIKTAHENDFAVTVITS